MTTPDAFVFDAYGTLFDPLSVTARAEALAPGRGAELAKLWRGKQLEYTWLGSLMEARGDFRRVTEQALGYALDALALPLDTAGRRDLVEAWMSLSAYPEAARALARLAPRPCWILSNGTRAMLDPLVDRAGLRAHLAGVLSVDEVGVYKPSPRVYALACERLALPASRIGFVSSNGWDATGAKVGGMTVWWVNRAGLPVERHGPAPDFVVGSLDQIAA
jgi:2-haloacid dehalogenase